ncbi:hypothetical protein TRVL_01858 [Trypanosoma vivax]|nr:hypothetical protein TRVL_01858 [Trypanosoma vivax]
MDVRRGRKGLVALVLSSSVGRGVISFVRRTHRLARGNPRMSCGCVCIAVLCCARLCLGWDRTAFLSGSFCPSLKGLFNNSSPLRYGDEEDGIVFVGAAEGAFRVYQRRVERMYEAPFMRTLEELESLGERWLKRTSRAGSLTARHAENDSFVMGENAPVCKSSILSTRPASLDPLLYVSTKEDEEEARLRECIRAKAVEADELLTQLVVQLDMAPVGNSDALRRERKASICAASAHADRIAKWMFLAQPAVCPSAGGNEEEIMGPTAASDLHDNLASA